MKHDESDIGTIIVGRGMESEFYGKVFRIDTEINTYKKDY
jgi:hypothetical protein